MPATGFSVRSLFAIALIVVSLHALALWAVRKSVVPIVADRENAPEPLKARLVPPVAIDQSPSVVASIAKAASPTPVPAVRAAPLKAAAKPVQSVETAQSNPAPVSAAAQTPTPATAGAPSVLVAQSASSAQGATSASPGAGTAAAPAGPGQAQAGASTKVEQPSSSADYLHNPQPAYPRISKLRGEQGRVVVNVLIGVDGTAQKADVASSSGFERLDQAALATVKSWRYVPGKRGGAPEAMWFSVPIQFVIE